MATGKQNSISSKLERLDCVPEGFAFDQQGAWQKIKDRRTAKSKKRSLLYAAILIPLVVAISWVFIGDKKGYDEAVVQLPAKPTNPSERLITTPKRNDIVQKNFSGQSIVKASPGKIEKHTAAISQQTKKITVIEPPAMVISTEEVIAAIPSTDAVVVPAAPKPKYKFKIAHINEINDVRAQPTNVIAQKIVKKPFLATVATVPATDENKMVQKKKNPLSFLANPLQ